MPQLAIAPACAADGPELHALIRSVYEEYRADGVVFEPSEHSELRDLEAYAYQTNGRFWCARTAGNLVGCVGWLSTEEPGTAELQKLYVHRTHRAAGIGDSLLRWAEQDALRSGFTRMRLWTDTRFTLAHRFYERRGYIKSQMRSLKDASKSVEFRFDKRLSDDRG